MESRIPLKPVLGGLRINAFSIVLTNRLNKTDSAVFLYCSSSLFLKNPFFPDYLYILSTKSRGYWDIKNLKIKIIICRINNFVFS